MFPVQQDDILNQCTNIEANQFHISFIKCPLICKVTTAFLLLNYQLAKKIKCRFVLVWTESSTYAALKAQILNLFKNL